MNRLFLCAIAAASLLEAKGVTVKIAIHGLDRKVVLAGEKVSEFHIWAGPGVFVNGVEQKEGFIIDWAKGIVRERPGGLRRVELEFYAGDRQDGEARRAYVVSYAYDPATGQGYVYLPGRADEAFKLNSAMFHGQAYEGNWFHATAAWDSFVRPVLAGAK